MHACAYLFLCRLSGLACRRERVARVGGGGGGEDGDPDADGGASEVRVEVGDEGEVDGGGVVGRLELAGSVEVAEGMAGDVGRADERAFCLVGGGAEGAGAVGELVCGETGCKL